MRAFFWWALCAAALISCDDDAATQEGPFESSDFEGDEAGECEDGADNDRDGLFDCDDPTCQGSPVCRDGGVTDAPDADAAPEPTDDAAPTPIADAAPQPIADAAPQPVVDAAPQPVVDAAPQPVVDAAPSPVEAEYASFTLTYSLSLDFDDEYAQMLADAGLGDCTNTYEGSGQAIGASGDVILFEGVWRMRESDCAESLRGADMVWTDASGEAFSSLTLSEGRLTQWVAHRDEASSEPLPEASRHGQFYITQMLAPISAEGAAHHEEVGHTMIEGMLPLTLTHQLDVQLTRP